MVNPGYVFDFELVTEVNPETNFNNIDACVFTHNQTKYLYVSLTGYKPSLVAHECFHLTCDIFEHIGSELDFCDQEPFAYLLGHLVDTVDDFYKEVTK